MPPGDFSVLKIFFKKIPENRMQNWLWTKWGL